MSTSFDWCSFYSLFWNDKGLKCKVNIPDTVLFRDGQLSAWWATTKEGNIQRHTSQSTTVEAIRLRFLEVANDDETNYSKFVAISRHGDGRPQLLRKQAFNQLSELLSDRLESGHPDECPSIETPSVLQAFIQPFQDLRYVTTLINNGTQPTCHTFQRLYSRRYVPMNARAAAAGDAGNNDVILGADAEADSKRQEVEASMGAVSPGLKLKLRKLVTGIVKYVQQAHNLTIGGLVCEFIKDASDKIYLISILRVEWASNAVGHGSGSLASTIMQSDPIELSDDMVNVEGQAGKEATGDFPLEALQSEAMGFDESVGQPLASHAMGIERPGSSHWERNSHSSGSTRSVSRSAELSPKRGGQRGNSLLDYPGGHRTSAVGLSLSSGGAGGAGFATGSIQQPFLEEAFPMLPTIDEGARGDTSGTPTLGNRKQVRTAPNDGMGNRRQPSPGGNSPMAGRRTGGTASSTNRDKKQGTNGSPGGAAPQGGGPRPNTAAAATSQPSILGGGGAGVARGPAMVQQLQREVEMLRDKLLAQNELAEQSVARVRELERERETVNGALGTHSNEIQRMLEATRAENKALMSAKEEWRERAEVAERKVSHLESERDEMSTMLSQERGTTIRVLREHMERQEIDQARIEQLQSEVLRLSEQLKIETTSINALKRQLLEFNEIAEQQKGTARGLCEPGMELTLQMASHLFNDQANPTGEMYAVQKVLVHYSADLRSVFLHYAQLEINFTDHWPPSMTFAQWMLFAKDSETADTRANSHVRNNAHYLLLSPTDCQSIFMKYAKQDGEAAEAATLAGGGKDNAAKTMILSYEAFLAALIHIAGRIRRPEVTFLSEATREYILRYLSKAGRVTPVGLKKGQVRTALQGTTEANSGLGQMPGYMGDAGTHAEPTIPSSHARVGTPPSPPSKPKRRGGSGPSASSKLGSLNPTTPASSGGPWTNLANEMKARQSMGREESAVSAIVKDLEMMDVASAGRVPKEVVRRGGGFNLV